jgi:hypothetical protein
VKRAILLLLAASSLVTAAGTAVLADDTYQLPPGDWRWIRFEIRHQRPATASCRFDTIGKAGSVRAELVSRRDLDLFKQRKSHGALAQTSSTRSGAINRYLEEPGEYAVIIENKDSSPADVHLVLSLSFAPPRPTARTLSPTRRLTVILVSFAMFFTIVTISARALLKAMRRP